MGCIQVIGTAHDRSVGCLFVTGKNVISAGHDRKLKRWRICEDTGDSKEESGSNSPKKKSTKSKDKDTKKKTSSKVKKSCALEQKWQIEVNIADTDYILQPKAMAYNNKTGTLFVGSKTNQIMKFEMKEEEASVIVDGHDGQIWGLCTHPEKSLFATGGYDNAVKIWDATTMTCIKTYEFELEQ